MVSSREAGKSFDIIQYSLMISPLYVLGREATYFIIIKSVYDKPIPCIILNRKVEGIPPKNWKKARTFTYNSLTQYCSEW